VYQSEVDENDRRRREEGRLRQQGYRTEYAENDFPALPVRTGVHAFVTFSRFDSVEALDAHATPARPGVQVHRLRLSPTPRSLLR